MTTLISSLGTEPAQVSSEPCAKSHTHGPLEGEKAQPAQDPACGEAPAAPLARASAEAPQNGTGVAKEISSSEPRSVMRQAPMAAVAREVGEGEGRWIGPGHWVGPCAPERPVMEILFRCIEAGRRYYGVRLNGQEIFVGTHTECGRFVQIHNEKVAVEQAEARRAPRGRPAQLHIYRTVRA